MFKLTKHLCPCCSHPLLPHVSHNRKYWFCSQCHQEMPDLENILEKALVPQHWINHSVTAGRKLSVEQRPTDKLYFCREDNKELQSLAFSDSLTLVANRLRFQTYLNQEWRRLMQAAAPLSLILGDLDFFKDYNRTYGHQEGDQCLQQVTKAIVSVIKHSGNLFPRSGGEEFIVILPNTKIDVAMRLAEAIIFKMKALNIPHINSPIRDYLTLSLGVASIIPTPEYSGEILMRAADKALKQAKNQGRDRIILYDNLLRQINLIESSEVPALPSSQDVRNELLSKTELLKSYVAYYLSRGKKIISPVSGEISFSGLVYQYWGYQKNFLNFWQQLQQRKDFCDLYIEGDLYSFGQVIGDNYIVDECGRCSLPIPKTVGRAPEAPNCTLCLNSWHSHRESDQPQSLEAKEELRLTNVVAIGTPPDDYKNLQELLSLNGFIVHFVSKLENLSRQSLPSTVDLVLIFAELSEAEGKAWAQELKYYPQLVDVPIIALSTEAGHGLPWINRNLGIADYILPPYGGDHLADYLRQVLEPQVKKNNTQIHWYPR